MLITETKHATSIANFEASNLLTIVFNKEIVKQVQNDAANLHRTVRAHPAMPQPHTNSSPQSCATQSSWQSTMHPPNFTHCQTFRIPNNRSKNFHHAPLDSIKLWTQSSSGPLIRPALQLCNEETLSQKEKSFLKSVCSWNPGHDCSKKCRKKRGRQQER
jgi:hypothetical protein